jgi:hypothetical protein
MTSPTGYTRHAASATPLRHAPSRICPACGGLECLCRPRFFAGQLLTEEDLNRLDHYIVEKHRLHNRHLHGWGVVCGLDVVCDDCAPGVIVRTGYALSPCGDDIVVCRDTPVPVCDLIDACRREKARDCEEPQPVGCDEAATRWVLAICYEEHPSRGAVPLRPSGGECGCGCGEGAGGCGCGGSGRGHATGKNGHSNGNGGAGRGYSSGYASGYASGASSGYGSGSGVGGRATVATASAPRAAALLQCEPTVVCEGYRFRVYPLPRRTGEGGDAGPLIEAFNACMNEFIDSLPELDPSTTDRQVLRDWCCDMQAVLLEWFRGHPPYACDLPRRVAEVRCPNVDDPDFDAAFLIALDQYIAIVIEVLIACFCTAIMPPCPAPVAAACVPLAVVTVGTTSGCRVESVCNWTIHRKYATTFPSLQYWLSILPFGRLLREALESLCCRRFVRRPTPRGETPTDPVRPAGPISPRVAIGTPPDADTTPPATPGDPGAAATPATFFRASPRTTARTRDFTRLATEAFATRRQSADARRIVFGLLGEKDEQGTPYLSELQREHALQFLVLDQMAKPTLRTLLASPEGGFAGGMTLADLMGAFLGGPMAPPAPEAAAPPEDLAARIASLEALVERQQERIDELSRRGRRK